jgi:hypothetical protein
MDVTPDKRQQARELADEYLGRGAGIARAAVGPLGTAGKVALVAGLLIWAVGPAPFWDSAPSTTFSVLALIVLAAPGVRLLRHRRRMQAVLDDLPTLLDNLDGAVDATNGLGELPGRWRDAGSSGKSGLLATGKRCYTFYRQDIAPLRAGSKIIDQVTDALAAFNGLALLVSGIALLAGLVEVVISPVALIIRLFI